MMQYLKQLVYSVRETNRMRVISRSKEFERERRKSRIIRFVHSIEKGMCLDNPRPGFGQEKIKKMLQESNSYLKAYGSDDFCLHMVVDVLNDYFEFNKGKNYSNEEIESLYKEYSFICDAIKPYEIKAGGFQHVQINFNPFQVIPDILNCRHSVRDFDNVHVSNDDILVATKIAQMSPSACNRQAYRAYVISSKKLLELYNNNLSGIGGFADSADKFIIITGKISSYDFSEYNQFIVSASIFASYLSLALLYKNIGSCIVQRPLRDSKQNKNIMKYCHIPYDEQIVLMMAIGTLKKEYNAPISGRFPVEDIISFVD